MAGASGSSPSGAVSSGGGACGGAGAAASVRISHPVESGTADGRRRERRGGRGEPERERGQEDVNAAHQALRVGEIARTSDRVPPMLEPIAVADAIEVPIAVFGALLMLGALAAGLARRSVLSLAAAFLVAGFVLGNGGLEVLDLSAQSGFVETLAVVALILILFRDGLEVEGELLQREWHLPFRKLVLAMPLTAALVALAVHTLTDLGWTESFLLGALLSPTDPVLSYIVVTNPRVPRVIRHSLNLESGLNDGLALPAVLAFTAAAESDGDFVWWRFVLQDVTVGVITGLLLAFLAARVLPRSSDLDDEVGAHQKGLYALGLAVRRVRHRHPAAGGQRLHRRVRLRDRVRDHAPGRARRRSRPAPRTSSRS